MKNEFSMNRSRFIKATRRCVAVTPSDGKRTKARIAKLQRAVDAAFDAMGPVKRRARGLSADTGRPVAGPAPHEGPGRCTGAAGKAHSLAAVAVSGAL